MIREFNFEHFRRISRILLLEEAFPLPRVAANVPQTTKELPMLQDRMLNELEGQEEDLDQLGDHFTFPLFNSMRALESQRRSGYRNTAAAAREMVDNAIEAGATKVHVIFDRPSDRKSYQRKDAVTAVAFIDNGSGMLPGMARFALSWGGGTHFDDPEFIGKFGF